MGDTIVCTIKTHEENIGHKLLILAHASLKERPLVRILTFLLPSPKINIETT